VVQENIPDGNQDMIGVKECISSHSLGCISSPGGAGHLREEEEEEEEDKLVLVLGLRIDCRVEVFGDGPPAFSDLREILSRSSARCRDVLVVA
jgi:hypothetical protein